MAFRFTIKNILFVLALIVLLGAAGASVYKSYASHTTYTTQVDTGFSDEIKQTFLQRIEVTKAAIAAQEADAEKDDYFLYSSLASDQTMIGDLQGAADTYKHYVTNKNTIDFVAWNNYGDVLERMGDYIGAEQAYKQAIGLNPVEEYYRDYIVFLQTHFKQERKDEILSVLEEGMKTVGRTRWFMVEAARWYQEAGDCDQAQAHYKVAVQVTEDTAIKATIQKEMQEAATDCK
jgi:tetratricopeptide (TPR) repeat protein